VAPKNQVLSREIAEGEIARRDFEELGRGEPSDLALRLPQRQQAEAALQAAEADLRAAELQLSRTSVRAPFAGRVRTKASDIGQFVSPGARLGRIFSTDIVEVRLPLTDGDLAKSDLPIAYKAKNKQEAPKVELRSSIGNVEQVWNGYIMRTDSTYDTQTRALFAIVEVFDPYGDGASQNNVPLAPGLFVDAKVEGKLVESAIVVTRDGLRPQDEIYVVDDKGKAEIRKVNVIDSNPTRAVIDSGLSAGELVIVSPMERSRVSMTLKVLDSNDPSIIIVDPPEPEWMKRAKAKKPEEKKKKGFFGRKDKGDDKKENSDKNDGDEESPESDTDKTNDDATGGQK